jgi:hypothetical protein
MSHKPKVYIQKVTPKMAEEWLERNKKNRNINIRRVNFYLDQMKRGLWQFVGDSIRFAWNGDLVDGQHRLIALTQYGEPLEFIIVENLDPESIVVIDTGKVRSAGDAVHMLGVSYATTMAAAVRTIIGFRANRFSDGNSRYDGSKGISNTEIVNFIKKHPGLEDMTAYVLGLQHQFRYIQGSTLCALYFILSTKNATKAETFFEKYASGIDLGEKSPIRILRNRLMQDVNNQARYTQRDKMALFIFAWNAYMRGRELENVKVRGEYTFPQPI